MRFNTLNEWLSWQETLHPTEIELGLDRVLQVYQRIFSKPIANTIITVAGTNGKGSSICYLDNILRSAGYRVGCYTSPHLFIYNERIKIQGNNVSDAALCAAFEKIDQARADVSISYFEFATLAALLLLAEQNLDFAVLEVGLGGRLDAVNIIDADIALITAIDLDHQQWLGNDRDKIAFEKAGIMRPNKPVVCSDDNPPNSLIQYANNLNAKLYTIDKDFHFSIDDNNWNWRSQQRSRFALPLLPLRGQHQFHNCAGVLMVLALIDTQYPITQNQLRTGILSSFIAGRLQFINNKIQTIVDVAHNVQATRVLAQILTDNACTGKTRIITAMMADKECQLMIQILSDICTDWYIPEISNERALEPPEMLKIINKINNKAQAQIFNNAFDAYQQAVNDSQKQDQIIIFGSFYLLYEYRTMIEQN